MYGSNKNNANIVCLKTCKLWRFGVIYEKNLHLVDITCTL